MNKSENINELSAALVKVQAEINPAKMDSENPFFKSKYADLTSVWFACRDVLARNGLAVIQTMEPAMDGVTVETILTHSSGQWISGKLCMPVPKATPQAVGSAITYARRYSLAAIVGIVQEDDDGETAQKPTRGTQTKQQPKSINVQVANVMKAMKCPTGKMKAWIDKKLVDKTLENILSLVLDFQNDGRTWDPAIETFIKPEGV